MSLPTPGENKPLPPGEKIAFTASGVIPDLPDLPDGGNPTLPPRKRRPYLWMAVALLVLAAAGFFGRPPLKHHFQRWGVERKVVRAEAALTAKKYNRAVIDARDVLTVDQMNVGATRVMARALDAVNSPMAATWRSRLATLQPDDPENTVAWAATMLKAGDVAAADRILQTVKPAGRGTAEFHSVAARIAAARRDLTLAAKHWGEAGRLKSEDEGFRLEHATIRLSSKNPEERREALEILSEISRKPPKGAQALRTLLADAMERREWPRAVELADRLAVDPGARFEDKLSKLDTLRAVRLRESSGYLEELRNEAMSNPGNLYLLFMWMNTNHLALMVSDWMRTFPPDVVKMAGTPPVCVAVADAYVRSADWTKLRAYLDESAWGDMEYLRRVFLANALERMDDDAGAAQQWKDAVSAARGKPDSSFRLERVARAAIGWKWEQRTEEVLWMLAGMPGCPRWVLDALWEASLNREDTRALQKVAGLLVMADPQSAAHRRNCAFYSLLIRSEDGNPHREAEILFQENPGDAIIAVTRGLSLYQHGKIAEAVTVTESLPPEELKKPRTAFYHALFLTAGGENAKAAEFLAMAETWKPFPEEKALMERAKLTVAKAVDERGVAEAAKVARNARAAREAEGDKAVEVARAARAAQAAGDAAQPRGAAR